MKRIFLAFGMLCLAAFAFATPAFASTDTPYAAAIQPFDEIGMLNFDFEQTAIIDAEIAATELNDAALLACLEVPSTTGVCQLMPMLSATGNNSPGRSPLA